jgi:uncharacterized protein
MTAERKSGIILGVISVSEGAWVATNLVMSRWRFVRYTGFQSHSIPPFGWAAALVVAAGFIALSTGLRSVKENLFRASWLKLLAVAVAVTAGICEECIFRKLLMDVVQRHGWGTALQVGGSALLFGVAHGIWGLFGGSFRAALGATIATGMLGFALACVYVLSDRIVAPAIVSHLVINLFIEPGLVLAATRGEMGNRSL